MICVEHFALLPGVRHEAGDNEIPWELQKKYD
jgi:hypothetical protein